MNTAPQVMPMFAHRNYPNAPIKEALIDIRAVLPSTISLRVLESIHERISTAFPKKKSRFEIEGTFSAGEEVGATARRRHTGYAFYSSDDRHVFQARLDGFTFSRLSPYESWEQLSTEAFRAWSMYEEIAKPVNITRIAVRYINQISIPGDHIDLDEYLRTAPRIAPELPQTLAGFLMQLQIPQPDIGAKLVLTQNIVPPPAAATTALILDIDLFVERETADTAFVWSLLEALRVRKNDFFEGCITDKTRELFKTNANS